MKYRAGFVKINRIAVGQLAAQLPKRVGQLGKWFLVEGLLRANWEEGPVTRDRDQVFLKRGQFIMGITEMAKTLMTTERKIRTTSRHLESVGEMTFKTTKN